MPADDLTLDAELAALKPGAEIAARTATILILDIERLPGTAVISFWDLSDYKGRRIHADHVTEWPRTICAAWNWYGTTRVDFAAEWTPGGRDEMIRRTWDAYDRADIVVGHNLGAFDTKKLKVDWKLAGLPMPSPWKTVDTLTIARREFGFESNTLDSLCKRFGLDGKVDRYDPTVAHAAVNGDPKAQRRIRRYNIGDVKQTKALYDALRGSMAAHPHLGWDGEKRCPQCGSTDLELQTKRYRAHVLEYPLFRCTHCGGYARGSWEAWRARVANTRGVRS